MRTLIATIAATALATTLGGAGLALADDSTAPGAVIAIVAHDKSQKDIDLGHKGFSAGDEEVGTANLTKDGRAYGTFDSVCAVTYATKPAVHELCSQTFALPDGELTSSGTVVAGPSGPSPFDWAITGGTGHYAGATGFIHVVPGNHTVHLTINVAG